MEVTENGHVVHFVRFFSIYFLKIGRKYHKVLKTSHVPLISPCLAKGTFHRKSWNSLLRELIFVIINFCGETFFKYFARIKFREFRPKNVLLPGTVFFRMRLKEGVHNTNQRVDFCDSKILGIKFLGSFLIIFAGTNNHEIDQNFRNSRSLIPASINFFKIIKHKSDGASTHKK